MKSLTLEGVMSIQVPNDAMTSFFIVERDFKVDFKEDRKRL